jgi:iron complex outermembrane receptor protein
MWGRFDKGFWLLAALLAAPVAGAHAQSVQDLREMSIGDLEALDVSSVTKTSEALSNAPAAIYVITHDEIERSGAVTIPEILRLAPNLQVIQLSASKYIITARGFSGNINDQNFTNKLLVLIDGRSVYTPLYSGVYWDMQDVVAEDIDRIEVISGPGATLWGANAVNGVINIITRKASQTQGGWWTSQPAISSRASQCAMAGCSKTISPTALI